MDKLEQRITELEIQLALQDELLATLNDTVVKQAQALDLQQAQLRLLYQKIHHQGDNDSSAYTLAEEVPPHY